VADRLRVAARLVARASSTSSALGGSTASKRGSWGVGRKRKSSPKALIALMTEWWMLRATSTSASRRSRASVRSTIQFEPLEPWTENMVRSAPCAAAAKA
jgi:hypothetical protein